MNLIIVLVGFVVVEFVIILSLIYRKTYLYWTLKLQEDEKRMKTIDRTANHFWSFLT